MGANNKKKSTEQFKKEIYDLYKDEYTILGNYINNKTKILCRHNCIDCNNHEFEVKPNNILNGSICPKCANKKRGLAGVKENYLQNILDNTVDGKNYEWQEEYKLNNKKKHKIKHLVETCGLIYEVRPNDFQQGYRCPFCADRINSKMINCIKEYLMKNNILFEKEKTYNNLKKERLLRFDYFINNDLLIEFDGKQHFSIQKGSYFTPERLKELKLKDSIKNGFVINNRINFIRFNYKLKENQIIEILDEYFNTGLISKETIMKYKLFAYFKKEDIVYNKELYYTNSYINYFTENCEVDEWFAVYKPCELLESP